MSRDLTNAHTANRQASATRAENFIEDVEWLIEHRACEHRILVATGYTQKPHLLRKKLTRLGRVDLSQQIFPSKRKGEEG